MPQMRETVTTDREPTVTERIYRGLHEIHRHGKEAKAIYLGHILKMELDEHVSREMPGRIYGGTPYRFAGCDIYCLVGHDKHFNIVSEAPYVYD